MKNHYIQNPAFNFSIPEEVHHAARLVENHMRKHGWEEWELDGCASRNLVHNLKKELGQLKLENKTLRSYMHKPKEIKPCPFCGEINIKFIGRNQIGRFAIMCESCETMGPTDTDREFALDLWNERVQADKKLLEACKYALKCLRDPTEDNTDKLEPMLVMAISKAEGK